MQNEIAAKDMTEEGTVRHVAPGLAVVETIQKEACDQCSAKAACCAMAESRARLVTAANELGAREGDRVTIATPRKNVMAGAFLLYIVPTLALLFGGILGSRLGPGWGLGSTAGAAILGLGCLFVSWALLSRVSKRMEGGAANRVRIVKVFK